MYQTKNLQYIRSTKHGNYGIVLENCAQRQERCPTSKIAWLYAGGISYVNTIENKDIEPVSQPQTLFRNGAYVHIIYRVQKLTTGTYAFPVAWATLFEEAQHKILALRMMYNDTDNSSFLHLSWRDIEDISYVINIEESIISHKGNQLIGYEYSSSAQAALVQGIINELGMNVVCKEASGYRSDKLVELRYNNTGNSYIFPCTTILSAICDFGLDVFAGFDDKDAKKITTTQFVDSLMKYRSVLRDWGTYSAINQDIEDDM